MNSLSWFLYLASVFNSVGVVCGVTLVIGGIAGVGLTLAGIFIHSSGWSDSSRQERESKFWEEKRKQCATAARRVWVAWVIAAIVGVLSPDSKTMYAIAASEVGEKIVNSQAVKGVASDAEKALQSWIKKQIEPEKKGEK